MNMYRPTKSHVILKAYEWTDKTAGGIYLPDTLKYSNNSGGKDPWKGKVLAVGPEVKQVKIGEIVRYQPSNYFRQTVNCDGVRYLFLEEILIYAVEDDQENLIRALENRIVFLPDKLAEKYGRLYLPQNRQEPLLYGTVVVAGKKTYLKEGDKVILENKKTWQYFDAAGKRYILTDKSNLLGTFTS